MVRILIFAYGNAWRGDDGVAWRAAEEFRSKYAPPEVEIVCARQLGPEMSERLSWVDGVIFLDASEHGQPGDVQCRQIVEPLAEVQFSHDLSPEAIVALAKQLYGATPAAFCITLTGQCFDQSNVISAVAAGALRRMVDKIEQVIQQTQMEQQIHSAPQNASS